ncbi:MAG: DUF3052 family protein [Pseudomonadota bacterium]
MAQTAGYSGTPLSRKLGIKPGFRVWTFRAPDHYPALLAPLPEQVQISSRLRRPVDLAHAFVHTRRQLTDGLDRAQARVPDDAMIWISWPKKSSGVPSEVTEDTVRELALPRGLVDVKVCAVDEVWSGLKLVVRKANRRS